MFKNSSCRLINPILTLALLSTNIAYSVEWPSPYNGVSPNPSLDIEFNNIGTFNPADSTIYSCLRIFSEGIPSSANGISAFDIGLSIVSTNEGTIKISKYREFNAIGALNEQAELPDCSGKFETTTGIYTDIINVGGNILETDFLLTDPENLILTLQSYGNAVIKPIIKSLPLVIAPFDSITKKAGSVDFTYQELGATNKIFLEFNGLMLWHPAATPFPVPHLSFNLPEGTEVLSMTDGVVSAVEKNDGESDYEVRIAPNNAPSFGVTYDHLKAVTVNKGDAVEAGQQLGESTQVKFEVDVYRIRGDIYVARCPIDFFEPSLADEMTSTLATLISDWEQFKSDSTIYNESAMYKTACRTKTGVL